ncbi:MAG: MipA/OmpV family protein [Bdellovibrionota bacterium]
MSLKFFLIVLILLSNLAHANLEHVLSTKPLYEFGVAAGAGYIPDYPASNQGRVRSIAIPQFRYRGLRLRSDEEDNFKARLMRNAVYGIDVSGGGAFSAKSDKNEARKGMRDLDWVGEFGPRFYVFLVKTEKLWVRLFFPVRVAFSTDITSATYQGLVFAPAFNARYYFDQTKFNSVIFSVTRTHTTHQQQEYYFQVDRRDVTAKRPEYDARSGYMSTYAGAAYIYEKDEIGIYFGANVTSYKGAANAGSPLHKSDYTYAAFAGVSWLFYQSEERGYQ